MCSHFFDMDKLSFFPIILCIRVSVWRDTKDTHKLRILALDGAKWVVRTTKIPSIEHGRTSSLPLNRILQCYAGKTYRIIPKKVMGKITLQRDDFYFVKILLLKIGQPNGVTEVGEEGMQGKVLVWVLGNLYKTSFILQHVNPQDWDVYTVQCRISSRNPF